MTEETSSGLMFSAYFLDYVVAYLVAMLTYVAGIIIYCSMTPHSEVKLLRAGNPAASLSFSATLVALAIPLAAAVHDTHNVMDIAVWGANAVVFQLLAYFTFTKVVPEVNKAIEEGRAIGTLPLVALQLSVALLNAAIFAS